jgi:hypothetical protein
MKKFTLRARESASTLSQELPMTRRKAPAKSAPASLLERLSPQEAVEVLKQLLEIHPELRQEAEQCATSHVSSTSVEDVAEDVQARITNIDLDALNGRAGKHSWGYVEPGDAAVELLEESIEDLNDDMKRKAELGLVAVAEVVCVGIVRGLYGVRDTNSDGALGWAPDFPGEHADYTVGEFIRACSPSTRKEARKSLLVTLVECVPEWAKGLERAADRAVRE